MTQNKPEQHTITHPSLIEALCRILRERDCDILIGESISFYQTGLTRKAFETSGIKEIADRYQASPIAFEEVPLVRVCEGVTNLEELYVPRILFEVDMVINVCKLKSHGSLHLSGAIKNLFGCLPGGYKQKIHEETRNEFDLSDVFVDIQRIVKPALSIMDAVMGLDGGPTALGRPVKTSRILASTNAAALDVVASRMIGYKPSESPILVQARKGKLIKSFEEIQIIGNLNLVPFKEPKKADIDRVLKKSILVTDTYVDLSVDHKRCTRCMKCIAACPVKALTEGNGEVSLDINVCISCYYCLHVCPENAIQVRPSMINRIIRALRKITGI